MFDTPHCPSESAAGLSFGALNPPADLAVARARLRALETGPDVVAFGSTPSESDRFHLTAPRSSAERWPALPAEAQVIMADLVLWRLDEAEMATLAQAVGRRPLVFLEPVGEVGWRSVAQRATRSWSTWVRGHHYVNDVPAALRQAGLVVTDINRFGLGPFDTRTYAIGRAQRIR